MQRQFYNVTFAAVALGDTFVMDGKGRLVMSGQQFMHALLRFRAAVQQHIITLLAINN